MVRFSGYNDELVMSSHDDGYINIYSSGGLQLIDRIHAHGDIVSAFSPSTLNMSMFISCGWDGAIYSWDWNSKDKNSPIQAISCAHYKHINDIALHPIHDAIFCSGGQDGFVRVWDSRVNNTSNSESSVSIPKIPNSADCFGIVNVQQAVSCVEWSAISPDLVISGSDDGSIHVFDCRAAGKGPVLASQQIHNGRVRRIYSYSSNEIGRTEMIFSASDDTSVRINSLLNVGSVSDFSLEEVDR